jgi:exonuclease SbcC
VPKAKRHPSIEQARKSAQTYEKEVNDLIRTNSALGGELRQLDPQLNGKKSEIRETETRIGEAMGQVRALLGKPPGPDAEEKLQALSEHVSSLQETLDETAGRLEAYREKEATAKDEAAQLKRDLSVTKSELSGALQQLAGLQIESKALRKELGKYSDLSVVKTELKRQNDAKGKFEENRRQRETESEVLSKAKDEFADSSKLLEGLTAKEHALKRNSEKLARTVNQNRDSLRSDFSDLRIDALGSDRDAAAQLERRFQDLESKRNATQKEVGRLEQQTNTLESQIERATEMRLEMDTHKLEAAIAHDLAQALRGDQFIAFIQEEAYRRLAIDGSVHLKSLSSDRYSFDFDKDEFVVVDHWNADEPRPVATLSGGESFLASLALALALAEGLSGLSHGRSRFALESLFLDEGFGTLDPETLDVVLQGIETLGASDRLVGIVSHIQELADRMPSRVYVRKAVGGSSIEIS